MRFYELLKETGLGQQLFSPSLKDFSLFIGCSHLLIIHETTKYSKNQSYQINYWPFFCQTLQLQHQKNYF